MWPNTGLVGCPRMRQAAGGLDFDVESVQRDSLWFARLRWIVLYCGVLRALPMSSMTDSVKKNQAYRYRMRRFTHKHDPRPLTHHIFHRRSNRKYSRRDRPSQFQQLLRSVPTISSPPSGQRLNYLGSNLLMSNLYRSIGHVCCHSSSPSLIGRS